MHWAPSDPKAVLSLGKININAAYLLFLFLTRTFQATHLRRTTLLRPTIRITTKNRFRDPIIILDVRQMLDSTRKTQALQLEASRNGGDTIAADRRQPYFQAEELLHAQHVQRTTGLEETATRAQAPGRISQVAHLLKSNLAAKNVQADSFWDGTDEHQRRPATLKGIRKLNGLLYVDG